MNDQIRAYLAPLVKALMALPEPLRASQAQAEARAERLVMETNIEPRQAVEVLSICLNIAESELEKSPNPCLTYGPALNSDLYECDTCSSKPGTPTLCGRCLDARAKAGPLKWRGPRVFTRSA